MSVTGGYKFFSKSYLDIDYDSVTLTVSTGETVAHRLRDRKTYTKWLSSGSDDLTTETITVEFNASRTFDRLHFINHNWKKFTAKYWDGSAYVHFSDVVTFEGTQSNVSETTNTKTTSYYEFTSVTTTKLQITIDTTQTADAEKYVHQVLVTAEQGTFTGYPILSPKFEIKRVGKELLSGRMKFSDFDQSARFTMTFNRYPPAEDHALMKSLWEGRSEFYFWICGGDESQFRFPLNGTRLADIYLTQFDGDYSPWFDVNVYEMSPNASVTLVEVG